MGKNSSFVVEEKVQAAAKGQISKSGKAGFARVTLTTLAALTPDEHEVRIHDARLSEPDYDEDWDLRPASSPQYPVPSTTTSQKDIRESDTRRN